MINVPQADEEPLQSRTIAVNPPLPSGRVLTLTPDGHCRIRRFSLTAPLAAHAGRSGKLCVLRAVKSILEA